MLSGNKSAPSQTDRVPPFRYIGSQCKCVTDQTSRREDCEPSRKSSRVASFCVSGAGVFAYNRGFRRRFQAKEQPDRAC